MHLRNSIVRKIGPKLLILDSVIQILAYLCTFDVFLVLRVLCRFSCKIAMIFVPAAALPLPSLRPFCIESEISSFLPRRNYVRPCSCPLVFPSISSSFPFTLVCMDKTGKQEGVRHYSYLSMCAKAPLKTLIHSGLRAHRPPSLLLPDGS